MTLTRRELGLAVLATTLTAPMGAALAASPPPAPPAATVWAPVQAQPGGGLQRLALPWALLQASPAVPLDAAQVLDAWGQVLPSAWAGAPPTAQSRRELDVPLWAWPEHPGPLPREDLGTLVLELDANGGVRRLETRHLPGGPPQRGSGHGRWLLDLATLRGSVERGLDLQLDWTPTPAGQALSVALEGSDDIHVWRPLHQAQLLDLPAGAGGPALQLKHIPWPSEQPLPRYLRLRFDQPVALKTARLSVEGRQHPPLQVETLSWPAEPPREGEPPRWRLDLPVALRPDALQLQLPALNQLLSLRLEQRQQDGQPWQVVQRLVAWRMQRQGVEAQSPAEPVQATSARQWRLVAEGPVPAELASGPLRLQWHWRPPQLITLLPADPAALAGVRLSLGAAGPATPRGRLALPTLMPDYQPGSEYQLPLAPLGAPQRQAAPPPPPAWQDPATRQRWTLWAVLGVSVLGLAGLAWRLKGEMGIDPGAEPPAGGAPR